MNKVTKTKIITCSLLGLASVSLFSVAFSAFIVTNDQLTATSENLTVTVGDVSNKSITLSKITITDGKIAFEPKDNDTTGPIIYDGKNAEDLTFSFSFTIENVLDSEGKWGDRLGGVYIKWDQVDGKPFDNCIDSWYITAPKLNGDGTPITAEDEQVLFTASAGGEIASSTNGVTIDRVDTTSNVKVTVNYAFGWGTKFNGQNPAEYATDLNYTTVMSDITAFKSALTNPNFTITIDAFLATAE